MIDIEHLQELADQNALAKAKRLKVTERKRWYPAVVIDCPPDGVPRDPTRYYADDPFGRKGGKSFIGLVAGLAVGGVIAVATGGIGIAALGAFVVVSQAVNFFLGPKGGIQTPTVSSPQSLSRPTSANSREAAAQQLSLTGSSESVPVPIVFGRNQMGGNVLRYDRDTFESEPIVERTRVETPIVRQSVTTQQSGGGGKGGGGSDDNEPASTGAAAEDREVKYEERVVGYRYYASFELGWFMGELDDVHDIRVNPGNDSILESQVDGTNSKVLTLSGEEIGGTVRIYKGNIAQTREAGEVYTSTVAAEKHNNYRHICFAVFQRFLIGTRPTIPNFVIEATRMPDPQDDSGATIATIHPRGGQQFTISTITSDGTNWTVTTSAANSFKIGDEVVIDGVTVAGHDGQHIVDTVTSTTVFTIVNATNLASASDGTVHHLAYEEANPAAIIWETITNSIWGRGESETLLNQGEFEVASNYFRDHNTGMSFHLESQDVLGEVLDSIRLHTDTVITWDGLQIGILNLADRLTAYDPRVILSAENLDDVQFTRDTWATTTNELRAEFVNRLNNFQLETIPVQNLGARISAGRINSKKIALKAFSVRSIAEPQARRILLDMSYPRAQLTCRMNSFERRLIPGNFVELRWKEFDDELTHTFWRVMQIDDSGADDQGFEMILIEDQYAVPYKGSTDPTFTPPNPYTDFLQGIPVDQEYLGDDFSTRVDAGTFNPARIDNLTIFVTAGDDAVALGLNRSKLHHTGVDLFWKTSSEAASEYKKVGFFAPWVATGVLRTDIPRGRYALDRSTTFDFVLDNEVNETAMLASANKVVIDGDDYETLTNANSDIIRVGDETILAGSIVDSGTTYTGGGFVSATVYRASNLVRGHYGTIPRKHYADDTMAYSATFAKPTHMVPRGSIEKWFDNFVTTNPDPVDLKASPVSPRGGYPATSDYEFTGKFTGLGSDAFAPGFISATYDDSAAPGTGTGTWTVKMRPRWHNAGAGIIADVGTSWRKRVEDVEPGYAFWWRQTGELPIAENLPFVLWQPDSTIFETFPGAGAGIERIRGIKYNEYTKLTPSFTDDDGATREAGIITLTFTGASTSFEIKAIVNGKTKPTSSVSLKGYSTYVMVGAKSTRLVSLTADVLDVYELNEKLEEYDTVYIAP